jgi:hypothetical protein
MKDIKDMNLTECIVALRDQTKGDVWGMGHRDIIELTDRIEELTRWILVSERLPTREDADAEGYVWVSAIRILTATRSNDSWLWSQVSLDGGIAYKPTHWKRITPPEGV